MLDGGADYVLHGDVSMAEIVAQVRAITRRPRSSPEATAVPSSPAVVLDPRSRHAVVSGRRVALTALEWKLLSVLMDAPGRTFCHRDLMVAVWGSTIGAGSTVSAHIRRLRIKIEPDPSNPVLVRTTWGAGYVFQPEIAPAADSAMQERP
jgi:DNA-binding response OmpR family regulator